MIDGVIAVVAGAKGIAIGKQTASGGGGGAAVDAAVVQELEDKLAGPTGALMQVARDLAGHLGHTLETGSPLATTNEDKERLEALLAEHSSGYEELVQPRFSAEKHVAFVSDWAWAHRDVARLAYSLVNGEQDTDAWKSEAARLGNFKESRVTQTATWFRSYCASRDSETGVQAMDTILSGSGEALSIGFQVDPPCPGMRRVECTMRRFRMQIPVREMPLWKD